MLKQSGTAPKASLCPSGHKDAFFYSFFRNYLFTQQVSTLTGLG